MKNLICLGIAIMLLHPCLAQSPYVFNYQGLARNSQGVALVNQEISVLISIISSFEEGPIEFQEEHVVTTSNHGIFNLAIGDGDFLTGNLRNIDWGSDQFFIRTEIDPAGGENYVDLGVAQLFSVPFALYALESGAVGSEGIQELFFDGENLSISNGNTVDLSSLTEVDDADPTNELQLLNFNSGTNELSITRGNTVVIPSGGTDADADPTNELQALSINGNQLMISDGNSVTLPTGGGGGTDNQTLSLNGKTLTITGGNSVDLSPVSNDGDASSRNELQSLSILGNELSISGGNSVDLPSGGDSPWEIDGEGIKYDGLFANYVNPDNTVAVSLTRFNNGSGSISVLGDQSTKVELLSTFDDAGLGRFSGGNGNLNILLASITGDADKPYIGLYNENGGLRSASFVASSDRGGALYNGPNGNLNIHLTALGTNVNHGFIAIQDENGDTQAGIYVDENGLGRVFADAVDTFVDNPDKRNEKVRYTMVQGPEAAAYLRGTGKLNDGSGIVVFPNHFRHLIQQEGMTVMITPLSASSKGIAVVKKGAEGFVVQELLEGIGSYDFDWEVKGVKKNSKFLSTEKRVVPPNEATMNDIPNGANDNRR